MKSILSLATTTFTRATGAISQLALAWYLAKILPKAETGEFLFYLTCFTFLSPLMLAGTGVFSMRRLAQLDWKGSNNEQGASVSRALLAMNLKAIVTVSILFTAVLAIGSLIYEPPTMRTVFSQPCYLLFSSIASAISLAVAAHFHGAHRLASSITTSHIAVPLLSVVLIFLFPIADAVDAMRLHLIASIGTALLSFVLWFWFFQLPRHQLSLPQPTTGEDIEDLRLRNPDVRRSSLDLWFIDTTKMLMNWAPILIAGAILSADQLAELNIAQRLGNLINFLLIVVSFAFAPKFRFHWSNGDTEGLRRTVARCARLLLSAGTPVAIFVIAFAANIMDIFGNDYSTGATTLVVYCVGQYFNVITGSVNQLLTMTDRQRTLRNIFFVSSSVAMVLGWILASTYGVVGAAAATAIALTVQNVLAVICVRRDLGFWVFDPRLNPAVETSTSTAEV